MFYSWPFWIFVIIVAFSYSRLRGRVKELEKQLNEIKTITPTVVGVQIGKNTLSTVDTLSALDVSGSIPNTTQVANTISTVPSQVSATVQKIEELVKPKFDEESGGRLLGKLGVVALLIGISFFLKYAFDHEWIGPAGRIALGVIVGLSLVGLGQFLRSKYARYSDTLIGGGIGILYLTVFSAFAFYHLINQPTAFFLMGAITVLSVVISVIDNAITLAGLGIFGGFVTPFLFPGNSDPSTTFIYSLLLDAGVLAVSLWRHWSRLNLLAFVGTVALFGRWFMEFYSKNDLGISMFFISIWFFIFLVATVAHHIIRQEKSEESDLLLVILNAVTYFTMSYALLRMDHYPFLAYFAVFLALVYFALSYMALLSNPKDRYLNMFIPAIAIVFLTIAIPLKLTGNWITIAWLVEGLILGVFGRILLSQTFIVFGTIVYMVGLIHLFVFGNNYINMSGAVGDPRTIAFFNEKFFLTIVAIIVAYAFGWVFKNFVSPPGESGGKLSFNSKSVVVFFLLLANILSIYSLTSEINFLYARKVSILYQKADEEAKVESDYQGSERYVSRGEDYYAIGRTSNQQRKTAVAIVWALYAVIITTIGFSINNRFARIFGLALFFITAFKVFVEVWQLGPLYRIISSITFGVIALVASFGYARFKDRIKEIL